MAVAGSGPVPAARSRSPGGGPPRSLESAWAAGEAVIIHGHRNCKTTRQTLPFVDRIHRRRARERCWPSSRTTARPRPPWCREQGLELPVLLEADPYPLAAALSLEVVPTVFLIRSDGTIEAAVQGFHRAELEAFAARLGVTGPLFVPEDNAPATEAGLRAARSLGEVTSGHRPPDPGPGGHPEPALRHRGRLPDPRRTAPWCARTSSWPWSPPCSW